MRSNNVKDTGQHFVVMYKGQIKNFCVNASPPEPLAVATSTVAAVYRILGNISWDLGQRSNNLFS